MDVGSIGHNVMNRSREDAAYCHRGTVGVSEIIKFAVQWNGYLSAYDSISLLSRSPKLLTLVIAVKAVKSNLNPVQCRAFAYQQHLLNNVGNEIRSEFCTQLRSFLGQRRCSTTIWQYHFHLATVI